MMAQGMSAERPLHRAGVGVRGLRLDPSMLADTLTVATMADGMLI